jgi:hypothetical protein
MKMGCIVTLVISVLLMIGLAAIQIPLWLAASFAGVVCVGSFFSWIGSPTFWLIQIKNDLERLRYERMDERSHNRSDRSTINYNIDARSVHFHEKSMGNATEKSQGNVSSGSSPRRRPRKYLD